MNNCLFDSVAIGLHRLGKGAYTGQSLRKMAIDVIEKDLCRALPSTYTAEHLQAIRAQDQGDYRCLVALSYLFQFDFAVAMGSTRKVFASKRRYPHCDVILLGWDPGHWRYLDVYK